jgi:K+-sensing histidine kinase KdpD
LVDQLLTEAPELAKKAVEPAHRGSVQPQRVQRNQVQLGPLELREQNVLPPAALTHQLGGEYVHRHGRSVAEELVGYVRESLATEVILGHRRRARWRPGDTTSQVIRKLSGVDVHILRRDPEC